MPRYRQVLVLNSVEYPLRSFQVDRIRPQQIPAIRTGGKLRWDERMGAYIFRIDDFSGPMSHNRIDMEANKQGHQLMAFSVPTLDGSAGYIAGGPQRYNRITPDPAIATTRAVAPTSVGISATVEDLDGDPYIYMGVGNEIWRSNQGLSTFPNEGGGNEVATVTGATQITGMIETRDYSGGPRLYVTGAAASTDCKMKVLIAGTWYDVGSASYFNAEAITVVRGLGLHIALQRLEVVYWANKDGTIYRGIPFTAGAGLYMGSTEPCWDAPGRVQFLSARFDDVVRGAMWLIAGGKLFALGFPSARFGLPDFKEAPEFPPLVHGCMWQRTPTVTDGYNIWRVVGTEVQWVGLPPDILSGYNIALSASYEVHVRCLAALGDMLLAGVQVTDGTTTSLCVFALNASVGQWRIIWGMPGDTDAADIVGLYHGPTKKSANATAGDKWLFISYFKGSNSFVEAVHLPRAIVPESGAGDEIRVGGIWRLPEFDGGDLSLDGTMLGYRIDTRWTLATSPYLVIYDSMDNAAFGNAASIISGSTGWHTQEVLLASGQGESFKRCSIYFQSLGAAGDGDDHPEIHAFEYIFRKRGDCARDYAFDIDVDAWLNEGKTYASLWTAIEAAYEAEPLITMSIQSEGVATILSQRYVTLENAEAEPVDPRKPKTLRLLCRELI